MKTAVERATQLKQQGDLPGALRTAIERWRQCRAAAVAEAIDTLSNDALSAWEGQPPLPRRNADFHRLWCEEISSDDVLLVGWLAKNLSHKLPGRSAEEKGEAMLERFEALAGVPPDSRIAAEVTQLFDRLPPLMGLVDTIERGIAVLEQVADERMLVTLRRAVERGLRYRTPELRELCDRIHYDELSDSEQQGWLQLAGAETQKLQQAERQELLVGVFADPQADGPRAVLADWLIEHGDPYGEFIALQLREASGDASDAAIARADALLGEHKKDWLGDLLGVSHRAWFRRGFVWRLELDGSWIASEEAWRDVAANPMLGTVEAISGKATPAIEALLLTSPTMRALQYVDIYSDVLLDALREHPLPQVRTVRCAHWKRRDYVTRFAADLLPLLEANEVFPALDTVRCHEEAADALFGSALLDRLRFVQLEGDLERVIARFEALPRHIDSLRYCSNDEYVELRRGTSGALVAVVGERCAWSLVELLEQLPQDTAELDVSLPLKPEQYTKERWGLDAEQLRSAASRNHLPLTLRRAARRSGKAAGLS